jgi:diguanylate cyclase (GGDEF)-like protein
MGVAGVGWRQVNFRAKLRLFFVLLVILPMIALAIVLFTLTTRSETGKVDAGIAAGMRMAFGSYEESAASAGPAVRAVASDPQLNAALASGSGIRQRMEQLIGGPRGVVAIQLLSPAGGELIARAGSPGGVASKAAPLVEDGQMRGTLIVSLTDARDFAARVRKLTGYHVGLFRDGRLLAATAEGLGPRGRLGERGDPHGFTLNGEEYRGRVEPVEEPGGAPLEVALFRNTASVSDTIARDRLLIGGLLLAFLALAVASAAIVSRALTHQIDTFLVAARRLARGDFRQPVPVAGHDEFAQLGREFNSMSEQLAAKIAEVERKREELEDAIRRVGDAFATGLDRQGVVELAVKTAVDACEADAGRAFPLERGLFKESRSGREDPSLDAALEAAERAAFKVRPTVGSELLEQVDSDSRPLTQRSAVPASADGAFGLAMPLRARLGSGSSGQYVGVVSIARRGREFSHPEEKLLEYLAAQAAVSIENTDLHQTVQRQAVTDELTGLWNVRQFHDVMDHEVERARRFEGAPGLAMLDIDDFKAVNDNYGHQQGDQVLAAVAGVLRDLSRDIDTPARYGGEEMAVVLPGTDSEGAAQLAERMREAVAALRVTRVDGAGQLSITASFGVASIPVSAVDKDSLIAAADAALYRAKRAGKNRVERADTVPAPG